MNSAADVVVTTEAVLLGRDLYDRLLATALARFPTKSFGYLLADESSLSPVDFVLFDENIRNDDGWRPRFEAYGEYFVRHGDAGFVATAEEAWAVQQEVTRRGLTEVAVFHTHQRHAANFSRIDYELHLRLFESLWHLIVSLRNPRYPRLRAFDVTSDGVRELQLLVGDRETGS
jgi:proteasome lid subunit RPN8/RPN11